MIAKRHTGLSLDHVWIVAAVAFIALRAFMTPIPPNDFWWHMATGRLIVETGQIPTLDSFSFTRAGEPFYNQSWLGQLLMYGLYQAGGVPVLILVQALLLAATYGLLLRLCLQRTGRLRISVTFLLIATMPASFDNWIVRPQTYALALFVIYLYVLDTWRRGLGSKRLWLLPILAIIWVNLHGSFVLGGGLIALTFGGEVVRRWLTHAEQGSQPTLRPLFVAGLLTGVAWLINPGGFQVLGYVRNLLGSSAVTRLVTEWAPQTVRNPNGIIFFLFVIIGVILLTYAPQRPDPVDMLLTGVFFWLALGAARNNIWFIAVATPMLVQQLANWFPPNKQAVFQGTPTINAIFIGIFSLMLVLVLPWVKPHLNLPPEVGSLIAPNTPVAAVEFLKGDRQRPAHLFHEMSYGSYLIWELPDQKVWADPRIELYPLEQWLDYQRISVGANVDALLAQYDIDGLLLSHESQEALVSYIEARPDQWLERYRDDEAIYFVRR